MSAIRDLGGVLGFIGGFALNPMYPWGADYRPELKLMDVAPENIAKGLAQGAVGGLLGYTTGWLLENWLVSGQLIGGPVPFIGN